MSLGNTGKTGQGADPASQETCLAPSSCSLPGCAGCSGVNRSGDKVGVANCGGEKPSSDNTAGRVPASPETFDEVLFLYFCCPDCADRACSRADQFSGQPR